jgi:hypothetical protein
MTVQLEQLEEDLRPLSALLARNHVVLTFWV